MIRTWRLGELTDKSFEHNGGVPWRVTDELQRMADESGCVTFLMAHDGYKVIAVANPRTAPTSRFVFKKYNHGRGA